MLLKIYCIQETITKNNLQSVMLSSIFNKKMNIPKSNIYTIQYKQSIADQ